MRHSREKVCLHTPRTRVLRLGHAIIYQQEVQMWLMEMRERKRLIYIPCHAELKTVLARSRTESSMPVYQSISNSSANLKNWSQSNNGFYSEI